MTSARVHPYATAFYAGAVMKDTGVTIEVPEWGSFVLARAIPGSDGYEPTALHDAMGVYPLTPMASDADLKAGLTRLARLGLVSVVLVPDPLACPDEERLAETFDLCRPFKTHYLIDRAVGAYAPSKHHRAEIRRAQKRCRIEIVRLAEYLIVWTNLYGGLVERRAIDGVAAFHDRYFSALADDDRIIAFAALLGDEVVAMTIWFEYGGVAYNHLGAANATGYANGANYALYDTAIAHFDSADRLNLGGSAGTSDEFSDGLSFFKRGFANARTQTLLCGSVLDQTRYDALASRSPPTAYFPCYRG